jgi:(S)-2-hydroxyglutarate dehydrogenase
MSGRFSIAVVGGGIVGTSTAMALVERGHRSVVVLEAEDRLALHQSSHNSGVIHSGLYYRPGSLKAQNCVAGRDLMYAFCEAEGVPYRRSGKLVVATRPEQIPALNELERRGRANGLQSMRRLKVEELRETEPEVNGIDGLWVQEAGMADFGAVTQAFGRKVREGGGEIRTGARVHEVRVASDGLTVATASGDVHASVLVNCAGLQCDRVARMCGAEPGVRIVPFRGEYYELVPERRDLIRTAIYPVPDPDLPFLGVHFTRTVDGRVEAGPNAVLAWKRAGYRHSDVSVRDLFDTFSYGGFYRMASRHWRSAISEMRRSFSRKLFVHDLQLLVPAVRDEDVVRGKSGVRAQAVAPDGKLLDDFHIVQAARSMHVLNAPSPAATASIAIGRHLAERVVTMI